MMRFIWPLVAFLILSAFLYVGLHLNPREVPSPLIDKPAPAFTLPQLHEPTRQFSAADMRGKVWLLNVWSSWCVSCREEHPVLMEISRQGVVPIVGLDYKDKPEDGKGWLQRGGNPYLLSVSDLEGRVGIDYGVYGVPETYLIDKQGVIRYKEIGPVTPQKWQDKILPMINRLQAQ